jgi:hypothetical protein
MKKLILQIKQKNRISQLWTQFGQKKKIENAYAVLNNALKSSIDNLLGIAKRKKPKSDTTKLVENAASLVTKLRGKIAHGEPSAMLSDEEVECIRFLDVLAYAQTLKRARIIDEDIELIIGVVYKCNDRYMDLFNSK